MVFQFLAAASATRRGFLRDRTLIAAVGLVAAALGIGAGLAAVTLEGAPRLAADLGWTAAGLFGWLLALGHGAGWMDRGGILCPPLLARPVPFGLLLVARFVGLASGLALYGVVVTVLLGVWASWEGGASTAGVMAAGWLLVLRLVVLLALALTLSVLVRPVAAPLAAAAGLAGWLVDILPPASAPGAVSPLVRFATGLLPNMRLLAPTPEGLPQTMAEAFPGLLVSTAYALLYGGALLVVGFAVGPVLWRRSGGTRR